MKKYNFSLSIFLTVIGVLVINYSKQFPEYVRGTPGPGLWPKLLGFALIGASVLLCLVTIFSKKEMVAHLLDFKSKGFHQVLKLFVIIIGFGFALNYLGFLLSSVIFSILVMTTLGMRQPLKLGAAGVLITGSIYVIFSVALGVMLPIGKLFLNF
jgi:putative tricarboxylic transport membrane protein